MPQYYVQEDYTDVQKRGIHTTPNQTISWLEVDVNIRPHNFTHTIEFRTIASSTITLYLFILTGLIKTRDLVKYLNESKSLILSYKNSTNYKMEELGSTPFRPRGHNFFYLWIIIFEPKNLLHLKNGWIGIELYST